MTINSESESLEKQEEHKEYRKLMTKLYTENEKLLNNFIFGISILAFPFLYNILSSGKAIETTQHLLSMALCGFCLVILLQIIALKSAVNGCHNALNEESEQAIKLFEKASKFSWFRDCFFLVSVVFTTMGILNIFNG